jgi:hypothetical protein
LLVKNDGVDICHDRVHLVIATGDLPASAELAYHDGDMATFDCRICKVKTVCRDRLTCFLTFDNAIRTSNDFKNPDTINVSTIHKETFNEQLLNSIFSLPLALQYQDRYAIFQAAIFYWSHFLWIR